MGEAEEVDSQAHWPNWHVQVPGGDPVFKTAWRDEAGYWPDLPGLLPVAGFSQPSPSLSQTVIR